MPATQSDRLLAAGTEVRLTDRTVTLRYSMRSLKEMEDHFGSVADAHVALQGLFTGANPKTVSTVIPFLAAGLCHEGLSEDALYDLTVYSEIAHYLDAIAEGIDQAFPPPLEGPGKSDAASSSPGTASTTPPPTSDVTTNGSGA